MELKAKETQLINKHDALIKKKKLLCFITKLMTFPSTLARIICIYTKWPKLKHLKNSKEKG